MAIHMQMKRMFQTRFYESKVRKFTDWKRYNASVMAALIHSINVESTHRAFIMMALIIDIMNIVIRV